MTSSNIHTAYFSNLPLKGLSDEQPEIGDICIANISPRERQIRLRFAIQQFIIALIVLGAMITLQWDPLWRWLLLFLFSAAMVSYFQARDKTWVTLAARGARKFGEHAEKIADEAERKQVRRQALRVIVKGFLVALPMTLLAYLLPL